MEISLSATKQCESVPYSCQGGVVRAQRKLNVQNPSLPCTTTQQGGSLIKLHRIQNLIVESPKCPAYSRKSLVIPRTEKIKA